MQDSGCLCFKRFTNYDKSLFVKHSWLSWDGVSSVFMVSDVRIPFRFAYSDRYLFCELVTCLPLFHKTRCFS